MKVKPTSSELEILNILWEKGPSTVKDVHEILSESKSSGYTTTLKIMQIMHEKKILKRVKSGRTHIYRVAVGQEDLQEDMLTKLMNTVFGGSAANLILHALDKHDPTADEMEAIQKLLEEKRKS